MNLNYPLLIDGGLSNVLEAMGHDLNHKLWSAKLLDEHPEAIIEAHIAYLKAGAKCISSASYQASLQGFAEQGMSQSKSEKLILKSVELAEVAVQKYLKTSKSKVKPLIAASIGPYGAYLADGSEYRGNYGISDEELYTFHHSRIKLLDSSNADFFACETIPSFQEAKVLGEILKSTQKKAWISFSCKDEKHLNDGTLLAKCISHFNDHPNIFALGVNCTAPKYLSEIIKLIKASTTKRVVIYPNSGEIYQASTKTWKGISDPIEYATICKEWISLGADIIGGCCRIGPEHIKLLRDVI